MPNMLLPPSLLLLCLTAITARAQDTSSTSATSSASTITSSSSSSSSSSSAQTEALIDIGTDTRSFITLTTDIPTSVFSGSDYTYLSYTGQSTIDTSSTSTSTGNSTATSSDSQVTVTSTSASLIQIGGPKASHSGSNSISSSTSTNTAARPSNTTPCNNYPEFCARKYSNITEVCAHNSAFVVKNNIASNQELTVTQQLNDGVRMIQGETHIVNGTVYNCHTSCELLNAGPWQDELKTIVAWLESNPYDVVTILIVNSDFSEGTTVLNYTSAIEASGIQSYLYEPAYIPQHRDQWPTLGQMILSGKRVVMFMDYNANQTAVPYVLDEFTHIWETPYSPTDRGFPCTQQRPPSLDAADARDEFMYIANHNLNLGINIGAVTGSGDQTILIPDTSVINQTNGAGDQYGYLEAASSNCTAMWGRPPNFLLVDYYNVGQTNGSIDAGSVFQVAAQANGVTYNRPCCGANSRSAATPNVRSSSALVVLGFAVMVAVLSI